MNKMISSILNNRKSVLFITVILAFLGYLSVTSMKQTVFPTVSFPSAIIKVELGYAPLSTMETSIVLPIERMINSTSGILRYSSKVRRGSAEITITFDSNLNTQASFQEISAKIATLTSPNNRKLKISISQLNTSSYAVLGYSLVSKTASYEILFSVMRNKIKPALESIPGVHEVSITGGVEPEIKVILDPAKLAQYKISPSSISQQVADANVTRFLGTIVEYGRLTLGFNSATLNSLYDIENLQIDTGKASIPLKEVAEISYSTTSLTQLTTTDRHKAVLFDITKNKNSDVITITAEVNKKLANISASLPASLEIKKWYALADFIDTSINKVMTNIYLGLFIVSLSIFIFLRSIRASIPIIISMIFSILISFIFIKWIGFTLNIMTLAGISAAIGILVDNASVVVENIVRNYQTSQSRRKAIIQGTSEVVPALIFSSLTTIAVFAPLGFLTGVAGFLFKASSIVIVITLIVSFLLSISLAPLLTNLLLQERNASEKEYKEGRVIRFYRKLLKKSMSFSFLVILMTLGLILTATYSSRSVNTSYLPVWDEGTFIMDLDTPAGTSLMEMSRIIDGVEGVIAKRPEIETYSRVIGDSNIRPNEAHFFMHPKRASNNQSATSVFSVMDKLEESLVAKFPDINIDLHQILPDRFNNFSGKQKVLLIEVTGDNQQAVKDTVMLLKKSFKTLKSIKKIKIKLPEYQDEFHVQIDQEKLSKIGLNRKNALDQIKIALNGNIVNTVKNGNQLVNIRIQYPEKWMDFRPMINDIPIFKMNGKSVPLSSFAHVIIKKSPDITYRQNGSIILRMDIRMKGNDQGKNALILQSMIDNIQIPAGTQVTLAGDWEAQLVSFNELKNVLYIGVLLVLTLLLIAFKSYGLATLILLNTLVSLSFIVFGLLLTNTIFNVSTFMGLIAAVGIVVNNGILIISFLQRNLARGVNTTESIIDACVTRLRPIMITSTTTILGFLPMALSGGRGGEMLQPFAIAIIFGILGAIISSLFVLPNLYKAGKDIKLFNFK
jgi:multidrug efflux pump subunit AcrB